MGKKNKKGKKKQKKYQKQLRVFFNVLRSDKPNPRLSTEEIAECYRDQLPD